MTSNPSKIRSMFLLVTRSWNLTILTSGLRSSKGLFGAVDLGHSHAGGGVEDLPLEVGGVHDAAVHEAERSDARRREESAAGLPRPPAPRRRTLPFRSFCWPTSPTSGKRR